jgi:uncharacterized protein with NAD-binding domain and iron-sulfur cluster
MTKKTVIVVGGGVAGLTAAHELLHRSNSDVAFKVVMLERRDALGGKARSIPVPKGGDDRTPPRVSGIPPARVPLPGEHGFRFFPGFYANTFATLKEIRLPGGDHKTVFDRLVPVPRLALTRMNAPTVVLDAGFAMTWQDAFLPIQALLSNTFSPSGISQGDILFFAFRIWQLLTSCHERRLAEYETITWWNYVQAAQRSKAYQDLLAEGLSRSLLANDPRSASARTVGNTNVQLLLGLLLPGKTDDHVLNGPTSEVWLDPWRDDLKTRFGGDFEVRSPCRVTGVEVAGSEIGGVWAVDEDVPSGGRPGRDGVSSPSLMKGDYYLFAVPVERMAQLIEASATTGSGRLLDLDPSLEGILKLRSNVAAMNGVQFFMYRPLSLLPAHYLCVDSPWSLTAIAEGQFWKGIDWSKRGDGTVRDVLSVCISSWTTPGIVYGRPANELSRDQILNEVWAQLKAGVNVGGSVLLRDEDVHSRFIDPDVVDARKRAPGRYHDTEPLFVNVTDTWRLRPEAVTKIPNMFLAADYVRTNMDLACMEAANEAARAAVNGILALSGSQAERSPIEHLREPAALEPLRMIDKLKFKVGLPWGLPGPLGGTGAPSTGAGGSVSATPGLPRYVERNGEVCHPPPHASAGTKMFGFLVRGSRAAIQQNVVDRGLNACSSGALGFRAFSNVVMLTFANTEKLVSVPDQELGYTPERACVVWTPVVSTVGIPKFYWYSPYIVVDNAWSMATGREVQGLPKTFGQIEMPSDTEDPSEPLSATTMVLKTFGPGEMTQDACVLSVEPTGQEARGGARWGDLGDARRDLLATLTKDSAIAAVAGADVALGLLEGEGPETVPLVFLKQFRSVTDSSSACYQAIVAASSKLTAFRSGRRLGATFDLIAANFSSHPIARDLGLAGSSVPVDLAFFVDIDFDLDIGQEIWRAPQ